MTDPIERRLLQLVVLVGALVPIGGGAWGALGGLGVGSPATQSHERYLSGLLLGIGLAFWTCIASIERRGPAVRMLSCIVVLGGLARLLGGLQTGFGPSIILPLVMELGVTPLILLWRERVERRAHGLGGQ